MTAASPALDLHHDDGAAKAAYAALPDTLPHADPVRWGADWSWLHRARTTMTIDPDEKSRCCVATLSIIIPYGYGGAKRHVVYHGKIWQPESGRWWKPPVPHGYGVLCVGALLDGSDKDGPSERIDRLLPPEDIPLRLECDMMAPFGRWNEWEDGDWADGIWDQGVFKTGTAKIACSDSYRYQGPWQDGYPHGDGVLWEHDCTSTGHFECGCMNGQGTKVWGGDPENDASYSGQWKHGRRHGRGSMIYRRRAYCDSSGVYTVTYDGDWADDDHHGSGVATYTDGSRYQGQWKRGLWHGHGTMTKNDGSTFTGAWRRGDRHGRGVAVDADGARYEGEWQRDMRSGQGEQTLADGAHYDGEWLVDTRMGQGVQVDADGSRYEGMWLGGERHGWGVQAYADGSSYEGDWREDKRHGQGLLTSADGATTYRGGWLADKRHGHGVLRVAGGAGCVGRWEDDTPTDVEIFCVQAP
ncbi:Morn repeat domain containing protein [Pandoravirus salinus]|uniref:Morn repeat domain containing protein n=1 Tax=Pandoravirus salinus TaxID=1349410 RepID=S4W1R1_9VIRU|nr:morn repeat domain [Pandoravirus salinus]AGO84372.1 Morn repeat domain containing protein [Pandoravirus salinus]